MKTLSKLTWNFLRTFNQRRTSRSLNWEWVDAMREAAPLGTNFRYYKHLLKKWDGRLHGLGGDPSILNWQNFRPLRLTREEDWSDWLGWLLENSDCDEFASNLFGRLTPKSTGFLGRPQVKREDETDDGTRRGDILLLWPPHLGIHLEVKIGDEQFAKTFETGRKLQAKHKDSIRAWKNFILIPKESVGTWKETMSLESNEKSDVEVILWEDVVRSFRKCLWSETENASWSAWAWAFCGSVESRILGLQRQTDNKPNFGQFASLVRWLELLDLQKGGVL